MSGSRLDGAEVDEIYADLTARRRGVGVDLTNARHLAREWLRLPANPNGRTNADVLKLWVNGMALTPPTGGKADCRFRVEHVSRRGGDVRRTIPLSPRAHPADMGQAT